MTGLAMIWFSVKIWPQRSLGTGLDGLHVLAGTVAFLVLHLLAGGSWPHLPRLGLPMLESLNEMLGMSRPIGAKDSDLGSSVHDLPVTMFLPALLFLLWPALMRAVSIGEKDNAGTKECARP